jgi:ABC-type sugar transport system substrate-binding protein
MQIYNNSTIATATKLGWTIIPSTDSGSSPEQQLTDIETLLSQGVNVLAIQPCDSGAIVPGVTRAADAGVAVIMTDIGAVEGLATTVVADEIQSGALACQGIVDGLKAQHGGVASGKVVQIQGEITSDAGQNRTKGFEDCIRETAPEVTIITVPTRLWDPTEGANGLQTTVAANPDVVGVYLQSDTQYWTGTKQVLEGAGMLHKRGEDGHVVVVGVDGGTGILQGIRDGYADADVVQPKTTYFNIGLPFVALQLEGKLQDVDPTAYAPLVIEKNDQGGITVKAPSTLATPDNADDPTFWGNSTCSSDVGACPTP